MSKASTVINVFRIFSFVINFIAATACGCYSVYLFYLLIKSHKFAFSTLQSFVALIYLILLSSLLTVVEVRAARHRHILASLYFFTLPTGKAFTFGFMGAVLLGALVWGWVLGLILIAVGAMNLVVACTSSRSQETADLQ